MRPSPVAAAKIGIISADRSVRHLRRPPLGHEDWLSDAMINTDQQPEAAVSGRPRSQPVQSDAIYKAMIRESKYPEDLFEGTQETLAGAARKIDASLSGVGSF
jgi:hypothetical protein